MVDRTYRKRHPTWRGIVSAAVLWPMLWCLAACTVAANPIATENALPGQPSSQWDIVGAGDPSIQGFATDISVDLGETVRFKVRTDATDYRLDIYRLGYYQGAGARLIATVLPSAALPQTQPDPVTDPTTGLIDCGNWQESASWAVPTNAVSGIYLARLVRTDTLGASHIPFLVRDDAGQSDILFQTSDTTWQAYNGYGGRNLYDSFGTTNARAYTVSYNRPLTTRGDIQWASLFTAEYPMVRWLEANGYHVSYVSGVDTARFGSLLTNNHRAFLSVGHDEYWSAGQRTNVEAARDAGLHLAFFSGNEVFWKTRWESSIDGSNTPHRTLVCYKETIAGAKIDPTPAWTGTWRDPRFSPPSDGDRPENELTGTIFRVNYSASVPLQRIEVPAAFGQHRLWRNTSVANLGSNETAVFAVGTLGFEWDECPDNRVRPAGLMRLSQTIATNVVVLVDFGSTYQLGPATHNLALYRHPGGALVFGAGTIHWSWGLDDAHDNAPPGGAADIRLQQATVNLLADMGVQPLTLQTGLVAAVASTDTNPPSSTIAFPAPGAVLPAGVPVTLNGTASDAENEVWSVEVSVDNGVTWMTAVGTDSWRVPWTPAYPGPITLLSRAVDETGNLQDPATAVRVTVPGPQLSIWEQGTAPATLNQGPDAPVELGVKFISDTPGVIIGLRFYKTEANQTLHVGHLWQSNGTLLASNTFSGETISGWQQVNLPAAIPIEAETVYVASYHAPHGHYTADANFFTSTGVTNGPLRASSVAEAGGNGVYAYGPAGSFPTSTFLNSEYGVDVVFHPEFPPAIMSFVVNEDAATTTWLSERGDQYVLEYTDSLTSTNWTAVSDPIVATHSVTSLAHPGSTFPSRFYRVRRVP